jgi:hypothetical protein
MFRAVFRAMSFAVGFALVLSVATFAQGSVAGAWDLSINGPQGPINAAATLKQDGDAITGTIDSPQGTVPVKGTIKGKTLAISFSIDGPQGPLDVKVNGEVEGDAMKGMIDFGMGTADFTAAKKK